jgi:hypothetical protein
MIENSLCRICPSCKNNIKYNSKYDRLRAENKNSICSKCRYSNLGKRNQTRSKLSDEDKQKIVDYIKNGRKYYEIEKEFNVSQTVISRIAKANNLTRTSPKKLEIINEAFGKCSKCNNVYEIKFFKFTRNGGYNSYCRICYNKQNIKAINKSFKRYIKQKIKNISLRCRKLNIPYNIDCQYLIDLYEKQNGLCFYTEEKMVTTVGLKLNRNQLSVDRIIPNKGYVKGNIVLCLHIINNAKTDLTIEEIKKWIPQWYEKLIKVCEID